MTRVPTVGVSEVDFKLKELLFRFALFAEFVKNECSIEYLTYRTAFKKINNVPILAYYICSTNYPIPSNFRCTLNIVVNLSFKESPL